MVESFLRKAAGLPHEKIRTPPYLSLLFMKIRFGLIQKLASGEKINKIGQGKKNKKNQQKREKKVDVMPFNKKLTRAAERKELVTALGIMDSIKKAGGRPDKHTYANIINVCVRCDDITKAEEFLAEMRDSVGPSVVPMTTMLKGYASEGMRDKAVELLEEMMKTKIANGRSVIKWLPTMVESFLRKAVGLPHEKIRTPHYVIVS
ncbi:pentatricopeptide repeat-containing protein, putative [Perkinsus marinus ATCC 50983]|uniref:Pentatricopeptide repeat-containing protein, putative n=1 Tax=Perkinsus marinus (strain ATCC 50983 / TXsc) TaxID=423536 RepID=C5M1A6_PERM5|nr:pentatricopeptide repeat-containing protein, putative [Perkinsus marinus ATCC 50983]EEQ97228.1 pentatricopeptide repeat-containing protein, putative [Perkinsus marinus ATCC 50983]|eukprot:XP_002764511.1 pentatricopeptide repeat-containing protein, putative [Perkinsus marinus ATCC 50983]